MPDPDSTEPAPDHGQQPPSIPPWTFDITGTTAGIQLDLFDAVKADDIDRVRQWIVRPYEGMLKKNGVSIGEVVLNSMTQTGDLSIYQILRSDKRVLKSIQMAILHAAAYQGDDAAVENILGISWILDAIDAPASDGWNALAKASKSGHSTTVEVLLRFGADAAKVDFAGRTALHFASWEESEGKLAVMDRLLESMKPLPHQFADEQGQTPLHYAAASGNTRGTALLVKHGFNIDQPDNYGDRPLTLACKYGFIGPVKELLKASAKTDHYASSRRVPLHWAALQGHLDIVRLLLEAGADVNVADRGLHDIASRLGSENDKPPQFTVMTLQEDGTLAPGETSKRTTIHYAAEAGHMEIVDALIAAGADVSALDSDSKTPIRLANGTLLKLHLRQAEYEKDPKEPTKSELGDFGSETDTVLNFDQLNLH